MYKAAKIVLVPIVVVVEVAAAVVVIVVVVVVKSTISTFSGARVLVAGGTGIIGSGVVQALLKQGAKVSSSISCTHERGNKPSVQLHANKKNERYRIHD